MKKILRTSFYSIGSRGFMTATTIGLTWIVFHEIGEKAGGIFGISQVFYYLFSLLTSYELTIYFGREVSKYRDNTDKLRSLMGENLTALITGLGLSAGVLLLLWMFYTPISGPVLLIASISGIIYGIEKNLSGFLLGHDEMKIEFIVQGISFLIVMLPAWLAPNALGITGIYIIRTGASILSIFIRILFSPIRSYLSLKSIRFRFSDSKEIYYFAAMGLCFFVQYYLDQFIISFYVSTSQAGAYFLAGRIFSAFCILPEVSSFALIPYISRIHSGKETGQSESIHSFNRKIIAWGALFGLAASALIFFTRNLTPRLFSMKENPHLTAYFLEIFSIMLFFRFVSYYTGTILSATRFQNVRLYTMIAASVLMIAAGFPLAYYFKFNGILYTRAAMEVFLFAIYHYLVEKYRKRDIINAQ